MKREIGFYLDDNCYSDYPGKGKIYDRECAIYAMKHMRFIDRFNPEKVGMATIIAQSILFGVIDEPKGKWIFK